MLVSQLSAFIGTYISWASSVILTIMMGSIKDNMDINVDINKYISYISLKDLEPFGCSNCKNNL